MRMKRREFLAVGIMSLRAAASARSKQSAAGNRIASISMAPVECRFHKFVAMNSYDTAPKGHTYMNTLVRIRTADGAEGVGVMGYESPDAAFQQALRTLLGVDPLSLYEFKEGRITGRAAAHASALKAYRHLDGPLFDLIGKLLRKPAWQLLGTAVRDRVEVYDGTLYFADVWFPRLGTRAVVEEAEEALKKGYRGLKLKIGRGSKWMDWEAGVARDIEVTLAVRRAAGPGIKIQVDGNNGYRDHDEDVWRYLNETAAANVYWIEEMFPESIPRYTALKDRMEKAGFKTLIAEGETQREIAALEPYLKPRRLFDVVQLDIRTAGFLDNLALAQTAEAASAVSVPHNWGSHVGGLMSLHLSKAVLAAVAAEDDRSRCDVVQAEGYEFQKGLIAVGEAPGLGLRVDDKIYEMKCKKTEVRLGL
jgi:L-alanine-DL-glutamate epimerase-like enolase superfamily enzyme